MLAAIGGALGIGVAYAGTRLILHLAFQIGGPNNYVPISATPSWPVLLFTLGISATDGSHFWNRAGVDDFACRSGRGAARGEPFGGRRSLVGAEVAGDRAGGHVAGAALRGGSAGPEPAQPAAPEFRIRDPGPLHRLDQSYAWPTTKPEQMEPLFRQINDRLQQIPGVRMVAPRLYAPMTGDSWNDGIRVEGQPEPPAKEDTARDGRA